MNARIKAKYFDDLLEEHRRWGKILGLILVTHLQGDHEALEIYARGMKIEYQVGEPRVYSYVMAKIMGLNKL